MNPVKVDGKALAAELELKLKQKIKSLKKKIGRDPKVVSYYNPEHEPSALYTSMKYASAECVGILFEAREYSLSEDLSSLEESVIEDNEDDCVDGVMLQMPAPGNLGVAAEKISPKKDVDGLTQEGRKLYVPATVRGVIKLMDESVNVWENKKIVVLGSTGMIGVSLIEVMTKRGVKNLVGINTSTADATYEQLLYNADIIVSATGHEEEIDPERVKEGFVFINVGLGKPQQALVEKASLYTPRIGGTGPMTVWALMENVADAFENRQQEISDKR